MRYQVRAMCFAVRVQAFKRWLKGMETCPVELKPIETLLQQASRLKASKSCPFIHFRAESQEDVDDIEAQADPEEADEQPASQYMDRILWQAFQAALPVLRHVALVVLLGNPSSQRKNTAVTPEGRSLKETTVWHPQSETLELKENTATASRDSGKQSRELSLSVRRTQKV